MTSEDEETAKQNISYGRFKTVYEALAPILSESQTTRVIIAGRLPRRSTLSCHTVPRRAASC